MQYKSSVTVAALAAFALASTLPARAADVFSDKLCPRASAPVTAYATLAKNNDSTVDAVIAAANDAIRAYDICASEDLAGGAVEGRHYVQTREAQFYVGVGRLQRLSEQPDSARKSLQTAIDLTKETIDWTTAAQSVYRSNGLSGSGSTRGGPSEKSNYHDSAVAVRDAAKAELDLLLASPAPSAPAAQTPKT